MVTITSLTDIDELRTGTLVQGGPFRVTVERRWTPDPDPDTGEILLDRATLIGSGRLIEWEDPRAGVVTGATADALIVECVVRTRGTQRYLRAYGPTAIDPAGVGLPDLPPPTTVGTVDERLARVETLFANIKELIERDLGI